MKLERIYFLKELLVNQINNFIFYPLVLTLITLFENIAEPIRPSMLLWFLCGLLLPGLYFIRCRVKRFGPFMAAHFAVIGVVWLLCTTGKNIPLKLFASLNNDVSYFGLLFVIIGLVAYSVFLRLHERTESDALPMPFAIGVSAVSLYLQHYQGKREWDSYYTLTLIIVLGLFFLHFYIREYLNFLVVNASSTGVLPEKEIFYSGLRLAGVYTLAGVLFLICTSQIAWLKKILSTLKQMIYQIFRFIFSLFPLKGEVKMEIMNNGMVAGSGMELPEAGEPAFIWKILEIVAYIGLLVGIILLIYLGIKKAIAFIKTAMDRNVRVREGELSGIRDVREKCDTAREPKRSRQTRDFFGFLDTKERIRRIYKKKAASYRPLPISEAEARLKKKRFSPERLRFYTAREMEAEMGTEAFAEIYERARYSNESCSSQDLKRMKELCR